MVKCAVFVGTMWQSEKLLLYPRDGLRGQWRSSGWSHPDHFPRSLFDAVPREVTAGGHRAQGWQPPLEWDLIPGPHLGRASPPAPAPTAPSSLGWSRSQARSLRKGCSCLGGAVKVNPGESGTEQAGSALPSCCCGVAVPSAGRALCSQLRVSACPSGQSRCVSPELSVHHRGILYLGLFWALQVDLNQNQAKKPKSNKKTSKPTKPQTNPSSPKPTPKKPQAKLRLLPK